MHFIKRKADVRFRWKTTMVHGEDKTSPPKIPFVSRSPWHVSVVVLVCLLACPALQAETNPNHLPSFETTGLAIAEVHPCDESRQLSPPVACLACRSQSVIPREFSQLGEGSGGQGEALSQVELRGPLPRRSSCAETMRSSTRLTEIQIPRGAIVRIPAWWMGEKSALPAERIPSADSFS